MIQDLSAAVKKNGARVKPRSRSTTAAGDAARVAQLEAELRTLREQFSLDRAQLEAERTHQAETQRDLEIALQRYADLFDFAPVAYVLLDRHGFIRDANLTATALLGVSREKLRGTLFSRFLTQPAHRQFLNHLWRCRHSAHPQPTASELPLVAADGRTFDLRVVSVAEAAATGGRPLYRTALVNVTDLRRAEDRARQLAAIVESSGDAIYSVDLDGVITSWNAGATGIFGWTADEALGRPKEMLAPPEGRAAMRRLWQRVYRGETVRHLETVHIRKDGSPVEISFTASPLRDAQGRVGGGGVIAQDITLRKLAGRLLQRQTEKLERVMEAVPAIVWVADDPQCRRIYGNRFAAQLAGVPPLTNFSRTPRRGVRPLALRHFRRGRELKAAELPMHRAAATGQPQPVEELDFEFPDGRRLTLIGSAVPLFDEQRHVRGAVAAYSDITARKQMEEALRRSEEQFRLIVERASVAMIMINAGQQVVLANAPAEKLFGYPRGELAGHNLSDLIPARFRRAHARHEAGYRAHPEARQMGPGRELFARRRDGRDVPVEIGLNPIATAAGQFVLATVLDMTERKKAQDFLRRSNEILEERVRERTAVLKKLVTELHREIAERRELQRELLDISEREQRRIGQDLHDGLGQQLTGVAMLADALREKLKQKHLAETADVLRLAGVLQQARQQVRQLAHGLQPVAPDPAGLVHALRQLANGLSGLGVECSFQCQPRQLALRDPAKATHLFRIAQEAVNNALRHGRSRRIQLRLAAQTGALRLEIRSDGRPWRARPAHEAAGMGLRIMQFRSEAMGGQVEIQRRRAGGGAVICVIPAEDGRQQTSLEK